MKVSGRPMKVLLIAAGCLFALMGLLPLLLTTDYVQQKLVGALNERSGREISIEGPLHINWRGAALYIRADKFRISNLPSSGEPHMVDIERAELVIKPWKMLVGKLEIPSADFLRPRIVLERKDVKTKNWDFPALSGVNIATETVTPESRGEFPVIDRIRVREGEIVYNDIPRDLRLRLDIDTIKGEGETAGETFRLKGDGTLEGQKFTLKAEGGSLEMLHDTGREFPLAFEITIGRSVFSMAGTFTDPVKLKGLDATLDLNGRNLADLFYLMHIPFPPTPPYKLKGHLQKEGEVWTFSDFSGGVGHSDLSGNVVYSAEGKRPLLSGELFSKRLDVADLGGLIGLSPAPRERRRAGDMNLKMSAAKLNAPGWPLSNMKTHIRLRAGLLQLQPLVFGAAGGTVEGMVELDGRKDLSRVKMNLSLKEMSLARFFTGAVFEDFSRSHFGGKITLQGPGRSMAQVLGHSDGRVVLIVTGGKISLFLIEAADIDIAELVPLLGRDRTTDIRCGIGDFNVENGLLTSRVFVFDTVDSRLDGNVRVNLKNETIDASLNAHPKDPSLLALQSKILVRGSMGNPRVMIDPVSTGLRGLGAVVLGSLAPVAALLPFIGLGGGKDADCNRLIAELQGPA
jgi:AsmA family protein